MHRATFETRSSSFEAYGNTKQQAEFCLRQIWKVHCYRSGADPKYLNKYWDDVKFSRIAPLYGSIDDEPVNIHNTRLMVAGVERKVTEITISELAEEMVT